MILNNYEMEGIVEVVNVSETTNCLKRHRCRHEMQLQDCVFRTRGRSDWVATVDLDERINIIRGTTVRKYIEQEIPSDPVHWRMEGSRLPVDEWHNTSHVAPLNHTTKSIIPTCTRGWTFFLKEAETFGSFEDTHLPPDLLEAIQLEVNQKVHEIICRNLKANYSRKNSDILIKQIN
ncbi:hypothetical protein COOONC_19582 [Cooperia oncophora]